MIIHIKPERAAFSARVLVIPHTAFRNDVRVREFELAKALTKHGFEIFYLAWFPHQGTFLSKAATQLRNLLRRTTIEKTEEINIIRAPKLQIKAGISLVFNRWATAHICRELGIDFVLNAATFHCPIDKDALSVKYVYDVVDNPFTLTGAEARYTRQEISKSDCVLTVTHRLKQRIENLLGKDSIVVPNGVWLKQFRKPESDECRKLRHKFAICGSFIISYIGKHHSAWSNLDFLIGAFRLFRKKYYSDSQLLIVGSSDEATKLRRYNDGKRIIWVGPVDRTQVDYLFRISDIGVLPFALNPFTHDAFPIKVLEYAAARKVVVSSRLHALQDAELPHVLFSEVNTQEWARKMEEARLIKWDPAWDRVIEEYDWDHIANRLSDHLKALYA